MKIDVVHNKRYILLRPHSRIDGLTASILDNEIQKHIISGNEKVIIDLINVNYISSIGLRSFIIAQKKLTSNNGELFILNLNNDLEEIFDISGFSQLFKISESIENILNYIKN